MPKTAAILASMSAILSLAHSGMAAWRCRQRVGSSLCSLACQAARFQDIKQGGSVHEHVINKHIASKHACASCRKLALRPTPVSSAAPVAHEGQRQPGQRHEHGYEQRLPAQPGPVRHVLQAEVVQHANAAKGWECQCPPCQQGQLRGK